MAITKFIKSGTFGNLNSLQQCLTALGAKRGDVYVRPGTNHKIPMGKSHSTIYDRFESKEEILEWARTLYVNAIKSSHPDIPGGNTEKSKELGQALQRVKTIIANKKLG